MCCNNRGHGFFYMAVSSYGSLHRHARLPVGTLQRVRTSELRSRDGDYIDSFGHESRALSLPHARRYLLSGHEVFAVVSVVPLVQYRWEAGKNVVMRPLHGTLAYLNTITWVI